MDRTADLDAALRFVIGRIEEQAKQSGESLNEQQSLLLANLPSSTPALWLPGPETPDPSLVPRDVNYERLFALAKTVYLSDRQLNPASLDWDFAFAVFKLNRHPMWGLLQRAGVKDRRPWWDQLLAIFAALLLVMVVILAAWKGPWTRFQWAGIACGCVAITLFIYLASQQMEQRELENHIERCRLASRNISLEN